MSQKEADRQRALCCLFLVAVIEFCHYEVTDGKESLFLVINRCHTECASWMVSPQTGTACCATGLFCGVFIQSHVTSILLQRLPVDNFLLLPKLAIDKDVYHFKVQKTLVPYTCINTFELIKHLSY